VAWLLPAFLDKGMSAVYIIPRIEIIPDAKAKPQNQKGK
jgi:hypothetical protein